jgi:diazepam-binding inhibitor (GABA receptor modulator, acyl-CoA-binding protein)
MAEELDARFTKAAAEVTQLAQAPDNTEMLRLYALYKQGTRGPCDGKRPGMIDFVGRAKYDAWKALEELTQDEAKEAYIALVEELQAAEAE